MKHTKIKRFIAACLAAVTTAGCASLLAYAENKGFGGNYAIDDPDIYQAYLDTLTDEQRQIIREKEQKYAEVVKAHTDGTYPIPLSDDMVDLPGFVIYQQETESYCGPACIQSVLMYIDGYSQSQTYINSKVEENFSAISGYVNNQQDVVEYLYVTFPMSGQRPSEIQFASYIDLDINTYETPTFLHIKNTNNRWLYPTTGHCVCACGITSDLTFIRIADPVGHFAPNRPPYYYNRYASNVLECTESICW